MVSSVCSAIVGLYHQMTPEGLYNAGGWPVQDFSYGITLLECVCISRSCITLYFITTLE